jgi:hypothetical protein
MNKKKDHTQLDTENFIAIKLIEDINNMVLKGVRVMLFNATVIDISVKPWRSVLLVNERKPPTCRKSLTNNTKKQKGQKYKQRSTKQTYKTKYRITRTPLKPEGELRYNVSTIIIKKTRKMLYNENLG